MITSNAFPSFKTVGSFSRAKSPKTSDSPVESDAFCERQRMPLNSENPLAAVCPAVTTETEASLVAGFHMTLKSRQGPFGSAPMIGSSPLKETGEIRSAERKLPSGRTRRMPLPSMTIRMRCNPGKAENGPSDATSAIEMRQANAPSCSRRKISRVTPPPFFHGVAVKSANRTIFKAATKLSVLKTKYGAP